MKKLKIIFKKCQKVLTFVVTPDGADVFLFGNVPLERAQRYRWYRGVGGGRGRRQGLGLGLSYGGGHRCRRGYVRRYRGWQKGAAGRVGTGGGAGGRRQRNARGRVQVLVELCEKKGMKVV